METGRRELRELSRVIVMRSDKGDQIEAISGATEVVQQLLSLEVIRKRLK